MIIYNTAKNSRLVKLFQVNFTSFEKDDLINNWTAFWMLLKKLLKKKAANEYVFI